MRALRPRTWPRDCTSSRALSLGRKRRRDLGILTFAFPSKAPRRPRRLVRDAGQDPGTSASTGTQPKSNLRNFLSFFLQQRLRLSVTVPFSALIFFLGRTDGLVGDKPNDCKL